MLENNLKNMTLVELWEYLEQEAKMKNEKKTRDKST